MNGGSDAFGWLSIQNIKLTWLFCDSPIMTELNIGRTKKAKPRKTKIYFNCNL